MIFDLDPSDDDFARVQNAARQIKTLLDKLELAAFVQTTGSRGLHVVVPVRRTTEFDEVRDFTATLQGPPCYRKTVRQAAACPLPPVIPLSYVSSFPSRSENAG